jgi:hypothetical protein
MNKERPREEVSVLVGPVSPSKATGDEVARVGRYGTALSNPSTATIRERLMRVQRSSGECFRMEMNGGRLRYSE